MKNGRGEEEERKERVAGGSCREGNEEWQRRRGGEEGKSGWMFMQGRECGVICNPMILLYLSKEGETDIFFPFIFFLMHRIFSHVDELSAMGVEHVRTYDVNRVLSNTHKNKKIMQYCTLKDTK